MSDLVTFARSMGIMLDSVPPIGVWRRYRTEDHPNKRNGAVKFMGDHAFLQNWAVNQDVVVWKSEAGVDMAKIRRATEQAEQRRRQQQESAARKAAWILKECQNARHAYLKAKGFEEDYGNVWVSEGEQILVIPMRVDGRIVGCQLIREDGSKKFLLGQRTTGAEYLIDNKGPHLLVEGYATALSVRAALASMKRRYTLHIAFSAGNLVKLSTRYPRGFVIADNDESKTGEKAAQDTGWPYFMPPTPGQDFNDFHREVGLFKAATALHKAMITAGIPSR
jgi:putative DNA primase/helicase